MSQLDNVRNDISTMIDSDTGFATEVTYTEKVKVYGDDDSLISSTDVIKTIPILFQPENDGTLKVDGMGQLLVGTAKVFFKHEYVLTDLTLIPKVDNLIIVNSTNYRITKLTPSIVNQGVAFYEGVATREDLD